MKQQSLSLIIDTATDVLSLAIVADGKILASFKDKVWRDMAARIQPELIALLEKAKYDWADISAVVVNLGPGSFTSIRIGLAVAKALGMSLNIPIYGACGLKALALPYLNKGQPVGVWQQAVGGDIYFRYFSADGTPLNDATAAPIANALETCPKGTILVGNIFNQLEKGTYIDAANPIDFAKLMANEDVSTTLTPAYIRPLTYRKIGE